MTTDLAAIPEALRGLPVPVTPRRQPPPPKPATPTRIHGWMADDQGCGYYRCVLPMSNLDRTRWNPSADGRIELDFWAKYDVVVAQRTPMPGSSSTWAEICRSPKVLAVFEVDDNLWQVDPSNPGYALWGKPEVRDQLTANVRLADRVTVSTEPLADIVRKFNPNVTVLPNYIDAEVLALSRPEQAGDTVTIGWAGSPTHAMDWAVAATQIAKVITGVPAARMHFIGARFPEGMPRDRVTWTPWFVDMARYYDYLPMAFDIGVAPLAHHPFNDAKSHIKALEYAAAGIPIVASDEEPYRRFVQHGVTGFLVKQDHQWGKYLRDLINDPAMRTEMGNNARRLAAQHTIQGHVGEYERAWTR